MRIKPLIFRTITQQKQINEDPLHGDLPSVISGSHIMMSDRSGNRKQNTLQCQNEIRDVTDFSKKIMCVYIQDTTCNEHTVNGIEAGMGIQIRERDKKNLFCFPD